MEDKKIELPEYLHLTLIECYKITASDSERTSSIKGYYSDYNIATIDAQHAGWWESAGSVEPVKLYTDGTYIYDIKYDKLMKLKDIDRKYKDEMLEKVKNKLTPEEITFLGLEKK